MRSSGIAVLLALLMLAPSAPARQQKKSGKTPVKTSKPASQPEQPAQSVPEPLPTPERGPSSPPEVSYQGGQLTIVARNSTMGDVLNAVKQRTGAAVEMPAVSNERVVGRFGPGSPRDVMAQLLNGSHYDYVLVGSPSDPGVLKSVVLTARASGPEAAPREPAQPAFGQNPNLRAVPDVETGQVQDETGNDVPPEQQPGQEEEAAPDQQPQQEGPPVVKTPEQLLRELQQQQQQQQSGQPGEQPPPPPPPQ